MAFTGPFRTHTANARSISLREFTTADAGLASQATSTVSFPSLPMEKGTDHVMLSSSTISWAGSTTG